MEARRAKTGRSGVWFTTAVPAGPSQQVCGFKKSLEPSPCLAYSEVVSWFFRISLRIFPQTVRMSRHLKRYKLAGGLTVLGDHERVPLLEELHDPPETPPRLRCADHLHAEASLAKKVWTALKVASIRIQPPPVHLHVRMDVVQEVSAHLDLQGAEPGQ